MIVRDLVEISDDCGIYAWIQESPEESGEQIEVLNLYMITTKN